MRTLTLFLVALLGGAALAGCTGGDDDNEPTPPTSTTPVTTTGEPVLTTPATPTVTPPTNTTPTLDSSSYTVGVSGAPAQAKPNTGIRFTVYVNGTQNLTSDHIGAHYANNDTANPPTAPGRSDCEHNNGTLPGVYNISCTVNATGTWYVFGHARITDSAGPHDWWAQPFPVRVRDYNLTLSGVPSTVGDDQNFTFFVNVSALGLSDNATSDHIGAHYFNSTEGAPTTETAAGACAHVEGGVIGNHTVSCSVDMGQALSRDVYVRGHIRIVEGGVTLSWWSEPQKVTVSAVGGIGGLPGFP